MAHSRMRKIAAIAKQISEHDITLTKSKNLTAESRKGKDVIKEWSKRETSIARWLMSSEDIDFD